ncbi:MAG TPA: hypothetical protein VGM95_05465 [Lactobacillaceae bacterium]|jgi:hypothetical protein
MTLEQNYQNLTLLRTIYQAEFEQNQAAAAELHQFLNSRMILDPLMALVDAGYVTFTDTGVHLTPSGKLYFELLQ